MEFLTLSWLWIQKYKKVLSIVGGLLLLLIIISYSVIGIRSCYDKSQLQKSTDELNQAANVKAEINGQIANLNNKLIEANANLRIANANLEQAKQETIKGQTNTNKALANVNQIENKDYSNTDLQDAERARCKAFPESCN